jgi:hypothetical protein
MVGIGAGTWRWLNGGNDAVRVTTTRAQSRRVSYGRSSPMLPVDTKYMPSQVRVYKKYKLTSEAHISLSTPVKPRKLMCSIHQPGWSTLLIPISVAAKASQLVQQPDPTWYVCVVG